jgi:flagellar protein FlaG
MALEAVKAVAAYQGTATTTVSKTGDKGTVRMENISISQPSSGSPQTDTVQMGEETPETAERAAVQNEQIKNAIDKINEKANTEAVFGIHEATNRVMIKIIDKDSKEVIKELPPEETLDMIAKVWELAGIFVDEKR